MPVLKNARHERFAQAIAGGASASEAYRQAGYKASDQHASRLARNGKVKARVKEITGAAAAKVGIELEEVLLFCADVIRTPVGEVKEMHPLCQEYSRTDGAESTTVKFKMPCKLGAIDRLAKILGWYKEDQNKKQEVDALASLLQTIATR